MTNKRILNIVLFLTVMLFVCLLLLAGSALMWHLWGKGIAGNGSDTIWIHMMPTPNGGCNYEIDMMDFYEPAIGLIPSKGRTYITGMILLNEGCFFQR